MTISTAATTTVHQVTTTTTEWVPVKANVLPTRYQSYSIDNRCLCTIVHTNKITVEITHILPICSVRHPLSGPTEPVSSLLYSPVQIGRHLDRSQASAYSRGIPYYIFFGNRTANADHRCGRVARDPAQIFVRSHTNTHVHQDLYLETSWPQNRETVERRPSARALRI